MRRPVSFSNAPHWFNAEVRLRKGIITGATVERPSINGQESETGKSQLSALAIDTIKRTLEDAGVEFRVGMPVRLKR